MGGDHAPVEHGHTKPHVTIKAPWYEPLLANKSKLCPPDFHYNRGKSVVMFAVKIGGNSVPVTPSTVSDMCTAAMCTVAEIWYPHGGFYSDPIGWRQNTAILGV